jgi:hypothetical protein
MTPATTQYVPIGQESSNDRPQTRPLTGFAGTPSTGTIDRSRPRPEGADERTGRCLDRDVPGDEGSHEP